MVINTTYAYTNTQPLILGKVTKSRVGSLEACQKTIRRRSDELSHHRDAISGGGVVQLTEEVKRLKK